MSFEQTPVHELWAAEVRERKAARFRRLRRIALMALAAALIAGGIAWLVWPRKRAPLPLRLAGERVILELKAGADLPPMGLCEMALSPGGCHLFFVRGTEVSIPNPEGGPAHKEAAYRFCLLDTETGEEIVLPFPPKEQFDNVSTQLDNSFTYTGDYTYMGRSSIAMEQSDDGRRKAMLDTYDIRNRTMQTREFKGRCSWVVGEEGRNALLFSETTDRGTFVDVLPLTEGEMEKVAVDGEIPTMCSLERAIVIKRPSDDTNEPGTAPTRLSIQNLRTGKVIKSFNLIMGYCDTEMLCPGAFWTGDGRFFCFNDGKTPLQDGDAIREFLGLQASYSRDDPVRYACIWDSKRDSLTRVKNAFVVAAGPTPGSLLLVEMDMDARSPRPILCLRDAVSGQEWTPQVDPAERFVCAREKHAVYVRPKPDGGATLRMIELAMPGQE